MEAILGADDFDAEQAERYGWINRALPDADLDAFVARLARRLDARQHLRTAYDMLAAIGMTAFAERARRELMATGKKVRKRTVEAPNDLTAQEALIARLARDGLSNPEISAQLFISTRTVEWHLRKVFAKLGVSSRGQLRRVLAANGSAPVS